MRCAPLGEHLIHWTKNVLNNITKHKKTLLETAQRHGVYSAAYGTVHYKEPLKSLKIMTRASVDIASMCEKHSVHLNPKNEVLS